MPPKKLLLLADPASSHTQKWAMALAGYDIEMVIFGLNQAPPGLYAKYPQIRVTGPYLLKKEGGFSKLRYLRALPQLKALIAEFQPDIVHAHYATSYGLLGALSGFHPLVISVWGSDIFDFPRRSWLHRLLLHFNFRRADAIFSTSHVMAEETTRYTSKPIAVLPFGVDTEYFVPGSQRRIFGANECVIGTVKNLETCYGIDDLLRAFAQIKQTYPLVPLKLLIVGGGSQLMPLKQLAATLGIAADTHFTGSVAHQDVAAYHQNLDIAVFPSRAESFGVAAVEAMSCAKPVIVTRVGGLLEVSDERSAIQVAVNDPPALAQAIINLIRDPDLAERLSQAARQRVVQHFHWPEQVQRMVQAYDNLLQTQP